MAFTYQTRLAFLCKCGEDQGEDLKNIRTDNEAAGSTREAAVRDEGGLATEAGTHECTRRT